MSDGRTAVSAKTRTIIEYHQRTKHHFHRYARSAGYMDWANQPNPFRSYDGASRIDLPLVEAPSLAYSALFTPLSEPGRAMDMHSLACFLQLSMGLSAWKQAGAQRWSLRVNPSSGNLHPTECHLIVPSLGDGLSGVFHYHSLLHALEQRAGLPSDTARALADHFGKMGFLVALSSIFWRESWKYGERAFRYCQLDTGHALAALALAARINGWSLTVLSQAGDDQIAALLGFDRMAWPATEAEVPELICWVSPGRADRECPRGLPEDWQRCADHLAFAGRPSPLSRDPVAWDIISEAATATAKPLDDPPTDAPEEVPVAVPPTATLAAADIIQQRRSAVSYDPGRAIEAEQFYGMLDRTLPRSGPPFGAVRMPPAIQLVLWVHRVHGIASGIYLLGRAPRHRDPLKKVMDPEFLWRPAHQRLPLWLLKAEDVTYDALELSCHQEIAGHSAFCVSMLAPFQSILEDAPYQYRSLHWECGMIGQVLYLEAEALGFRGTGIGCFFDDGVHERLGIRDLSYQVLYHFTEGYAVEDTRISTLPAYYHLKRK